MAPTADGGMTYAEKYQDAILSNSGLTDGLTDDQAKPFIDWMMKQADHVGTMVQTDEDFEAKQTSLNRLILFISRFVQRRHEHINDEVWVDTQIGRLNEYSANLGGPRMSEEMHQRYQDTSALSHEAVLNELMQVYNLAGEVETAPTEDDTRSMTRSELGISLNPAMALDAADDDDSMIQAMESPVENPENSEPESDTDTKFDKGSLADFF